MYYVGTKRSRANNSLIYVDASDWNGGFGTDSRALSAGEKPTKGDKKAKRKYPDLATSPQIEYLVLACEEGGRWDQHRLLRSLVRTKVGSIHTLLRRRASLAYTRRWWGILSIGAQTVAADCILGRESPVPAPTSAMPLASVLPLIDIGTEPSRMR